jgi:hypothetical protein
MKLLKVVAVTYLIKTLIIGVAWLFVPDLPSRTMGALRATWAWMDWDRAGDAYSETMSSPRGPSDSKQQ